MRGGGVATCACCLRCLPSVGRSQWRAASARTWSLGFTGARLARETGDDVVARGRARARGAAPPEAGTWLQGGEWRAHPESSDEPVAREPRDAALAVRRPGQGTRTERRRSGASATGSRCTSRRRSASTATTSYRCSSAIRVVGRAEPRFDRKTGRLEFARRLGRHLAARRGARQPRGVSRSHPLIRAARADEGDALAAIQRSGRRSRRWRTSFRRSSTPTRVEEIRRRWRGALAQGRSALVYEDEGEPVWASR